MESLGSKQVNKENNNSISFIHSFVRSFIRSFIHSFIHSFVHSFVHSFIRSFIHSFVHSFIRLFIHSFIHSIGMCRMQRFLAVLRSFFHSSLLQNLSFHPFPPTSLPSSVTSSCHLFLGLPLSLIVSKFIYDTFLGILFSSILCTSPKQRNLFNPLAYYFL